MNNLDQSILIIDTVTDKMDKRFNTKEHLKNKREELDAEYPQYQGCNNTDDNDWDMRETDYL